MLVVQEKNVQEHLNVNFSYILKAWKKGFRIVAEISS